MKRLENYTAVITGGARGIGKAICEVFAKEGATTAVTDILDEEGQDLVKEIRKEGMEAAFFHLNTRDEAQVKDVLSQVNEKFKGIQVLVNNAGISGPNNPT
ncbi:MAG: SDR family NAD(P)-dependent oxidoreductase, partial [Deltaproteobacteria bacterium]